jgi:hypothetical protein
MQNLRSAMFKEARARVAEALKPYGSSDQRKEIVAALLSNVNFLFGEYKPETGPTGAKVSAHMSYDLSTANEGQKFMYRSEYIYAPFGAYLNAIRAGLKYEGPYPGLPIGGLALAACAVSSSSTSNVFVSDYHVEPACAPGVDER